ncbi:adenosylcobinamide-GDP ribazoletransferase [Stappia sp. ES.058]|uniref:adenosylcobinamide-GDP ribazoletransferase n=1 Tax=Stappia sp. ES.058 TaxID=1881061 RepID=UPI00087DB38A|nr:adenosylcobinamide-GDP ribazoletransferase [Stappia sp. ES.058]SDU04668.1 cobalamin-5'-phosphate synthase [Stappia sp. ES.058]
MPSADDRLETATVWTSGLLIADVAATLRFFSRLPVPRINADDDPARLPDFRRAAAVTPLSALIVALPGAAIFLLASLTALPAAVAALLGLSANIALTGALHEDGLADVADGFYGAGTPDRRLEIMKDSRIGAFGTLALILTLALKTALLSTLMERFGAPSAVLGWLAVESGSRAVLVGVWRALPAARPGGLSALCGTPARRAVACALMLALMVFAVCLVVYSLTAILLAAFAQAMTGYGVARIAMAKIVGQTGDVLGAAQQLACLGGLTGLCILV